MALTAVEQVILNGPRNVVVKYTFGGTTGDVTALQLVDASDFGVSNLKIKRVKSVLTGFSGALLWDASTDVDALGLVEGEVDHDFTAFGGLTNTKATGYTGDIMLRTDGYTAAAGEDNSYILLELVKK
jgi:hypothetical protein